MAEIVRIKKVRSTIGVTGKTLRVMVALGFPNKCGVGKHVFHILTPQIQGMINKVGHLVCIIK